MVISVARSNFFRWNFERDLSLCTLPHTRTSTERVKEHCVFVWIIQLFVQQLHTQSYAYGKQPVPWNHLINQGNFKVYHS